MQNMRRAPREFLRQTALCKIFYSDLKLQNCGTAAKFYRPSVVRAVNCSANQNSSPRAFVTGENKKTRTKCSGQTADKKA